VGTALKVYIFTLNLHTAFEILIPELYMINIFEFGKTLTIILYYCYTLNIENIRSKSYYCKLSEAYADDLETNLLQRESLLLK